MLSFIVFMVILSVFFGFVDFYCCVLCFVWLNIFIAGCVELFMGIFLKFFIY